MRTYTCIVSTYIYRERENLFAYLLLSTCVFTSCESEPTKPNIAILLKTSTSIDRLFPRPYTRLGGMNRWPGSRGLNGLWCLGLQKLSRV